PGEDHELDVLHVLALVEMLEQAPQHGRFELGLRARIEIRDGLLTHRAPLTHRSSVLVQACRYYAAFFVAGRPSRREPTSSGPLARPRFYGAAPRAAGSRCRRSRPGSCTKYREPSGSSAKRRPTVRPRRLPGR